MKLILCAAAVAIGMCCPVRAEDAPADPRAVIQTTIEKLFELKPELRTVEVNGFTGRTGHSLCGSALTEALLVGLDEEARHPNRVLRERPLTVRRAGTASAGAEGEAAIALGQLDVDAQGRAHVSLSFRQGDAVLAPSGRVPVALDKLGCDPAMRPFLEHVAAGARTDRERIDVTAPVFAPGQRLEITIALRQPAQLRCWVVAEDGTAFVTLPAGAATPETKVGIHRYPRDFKLDDIVLGQRFENLFACFSAAEPLPETLAAEWQRHVPAQGRDTPLISAGSVQALMDMMRRTPGVSEGVARVVVR
jgi:hypothetical protein